MALIAVVGKGRNCPPDVAALAREVGSTVAMHGHHVVTGGYAGVMVAAARGAADIGLAPPIALLPEGRAVPEDFPVESIVIPTGLSIPVRNVLVGSCCAAMVALHGSHGAMQELAVAIDRDVPVVAVDTHRWEGLGVTRITHDELSAWLRQLD